MKKLILILLLFMPTMVYADASSPSILGYDAIVINKNGAKDLYKDETIPYNTKIYVINEYDNEVRACKSSNKDDCYGNAYDISIKDIAVLKEEVLPKDLANVNNMGTELEKMNTKILVINKKGIQLRKGPSNVYGGYSKVVPYNTVLTITYGIPYYSPEASLGWLYVDSGEYKGWIEEEYASYINSSIMTFTNIKMYDAVTDQEIYTIAPETVINNYYSGTYNKEIYIYFNYKDKFGYIKGKDIAIGYKGEMGYILTTKSVELKSNGKTISSVPSGERIKILYAEPDDLSEHGMHSTNPVCIKKNNCLYYIEYNGTKGFVDSNSVISLIYDYSVENRKYAKELVMYDAEYYNDSSLYDNKMKIEDYSKKHELGVTIPANEQVTYYMSSYISESDSNTYYYLDLVKYNKKIGWVIREIEKGGIDPEPTATPKEETKEENKYFFDKTTDTIIYAIFGAIIVSAAAISTIVIINNKKKNKKEVVVPKKENNDEKKEEPKKKEKKKNNKKNEG